MASAAVALPAGIPAGPIAGAAPGVAGAGPARGAGARRVASLYVGDLHPDVAESDLFQFFRTFAPVASVHVCRNNMTRQSLGYAYVNFHSLEDAEKVLLTQNYSKIRGRTVRIMWSQRDPSLRRSGVGNIFIKSLPLTWDSKDLSDRFSDFGNVLSCKVAMDAESGKSRGYGFVQYETADMARASIAAMHGKSIDGFELQVEEYRHRTARANEARWTNVYAKHFPTDWTDAQLTAFFANYGPVTSLATRRDETSKALFCFVNFAEHEHAVEACERLNGTTIEGEQRALVVTRHQNRRERQRDQQRKVEARRRERAQNMVGRNVYVKHLPEDMTEEKVRELLSEFGPVASLHLAAREAAFTGVAFALYEHAEDAAKAVEALRKRTLATGPDAKPLYVSLWQPKNQRAQQLQQLQRQRQQMRVPYMPVLNMMRVPGLAGRPDMVAQMMQIQAMFLQMQQQQRRRGPRGAPVPAAGAQAVDPQAAFKYTTQARNMMPGMAPMMHMMGPMAGGVPGMPYAMPVPQGVVQQQGGVVAGMPAGMPAGPGGVDGGAARHPLLQLSDIQDEQQRKNMIGEVLYPKVEAREPEYAGKITGMLLEGMDVSELLNLVESEDALSAKIAEAMDVLRQHGADA